MISGANATVYVSDMDRAVRFYTETLGFKLRERHGNFWASVDAGEGFVIGLHPAGDRTPKAGTHGSIEIGFTVTQKIEDVMSVLANRGVAFPGGAKGDGPVKTAYFTDPDGTTLYLIQISY